VPSNLVTILSPDFSAESLDSVLLPHAANETVAIAVSAIVAKLLIFIFLSP
jgi:hypothetical protein